MLLAKPLIAEATVISPELVSRSGSAGKSAAILPE